MRRSLRGRLLTPQGVTPGTLHFHHAIESLEPGPDRGPYVLPGFIDVHVHGGGGGDVMEGAAGVRKAAAFHLQHGTTTLYPTTLTNPWERVLAALAGVREVMDGADPKLPSVPGVHLEGPFISPQRLGAQPPNAVEPTPERVALILALNVVRLATIAPEVSGARAAAERFAEAGVRVSVGHTVADYPTTRRFTRAVREAGGVVGFTHLYNAMGGLSARTPGVVGAALSDPESYAELIFDTHHVHEASLQVALAAKGDRLIFITDAIVAAGQEVGACSVGGQRAIVRDGTVRLPEGTLAGSMLTLDKALRNAVAVGLPLARVSRLVADAPARYMGLEDRGRLEPGLRADLVVLDEALEVSEVYVAGRKVVG